MQGIPPGDRGLKDHEVARLVNAVHDELDSIIKLGSLRVRISNAVNRSLLSMDLLIDRPFLMCANCRYRLYVESTKGWPPGPKSLNVTCPQCSGNYWTKL
jgi:hypothetical protein